MSLETEVREVIRETLLISLGDVEDDADLRTAHDVDSLRALEVIAALEGRWNVMFPEERFGELVSVRAIVGQLRELGVEG